MTAPQPELEFSRELLLDERQGHRRVVVTASPSERAALARRLNLLELNSLEATGTLLPGAAGRWTLRAKLRAEIVQACVITLEPVASTIEEEFEIEFAPLEEASEVELTIADADPLPADGRLDVGEIVAQQLSLCLDPFPRAVGAGPGDRIESPDAGTGKVAPFAELAARLRGRSREGSGDA